MPRRNKSAHSTTNAKASLYSLTNEDLKTFKRISPDLNEAIRGLAADEILALRRNIDILSRSHPHKDTCPPVDDDDSTNILSSFSSHFTSLRFKFLSEKRDMGRKEDPVYPIRLYLKIEDDTTKKEIEKCWPEIKYWRDYIRRAQGAQMGRTAEEFLFLLHEGNLRRQGYGSLAKVLNDTLEKLLRQDISNNDWIKNFEAELREYVSNNPGGPAQCANIIKGVWGSYTSPNPATKKRRLAKVYKNAPIKSLQSFDSIPKENPFENLQALALPILMIFSFKETKARQCIEEAMKDLMEERPMKKIITAGHVREILRWWRTKYGYPSPGKVRMG